MIKISYRGADLKEINDNILNIVSELERIFFISPANIFIQIFNNRADFNIRLGRQTPSWLVANASDDDQINILSPESIKNESSHKSEEFYQILKHELAHIFVNKLANGNFIPKWLNEGVASYVAKQHLKDKKQIIIKMGFCDELSSSQGWNNSIENNAYEKASYFVKYLIDKYSFKKITELISSQSDNYDRDTFNKIFLNIYSESLTDVENIFIQEYSNKNK